MPQHAPAEIWIMPQRPKKTQRSIKTEKEFILSETRLLSRFLAGPEASAAREVLAFRDESILLLSHSRVFFPPLGPLELSFSGEGLLRKLYFEGKGRPDSPEDAVQTWVRVNGTNSSLLRTLRKRIRAMR